FVFVLLDGDANGQVLDAGVGLLPQHAGGNNERRREGHHAHWPILREEPPVVDVVPPPGPAPVPTESALALPLPRGWVGFCGVAATCDAEPAASRSRSIFCISWTGSSLRLGLAGTGPVTSVAGVRGA